MYVLVKYGCQLVKSFFFKKKWTYFMTPFIYEVCVRIEYDEGSVHSLTSSCIHKKNTTKYYAFARNLPDDVVVIRISLCRVFYLRWSFFFAPTSNWNKLILFLLWLLSKYYEKIFSLDRHDNYTQLTLSHICWLLCTNVMCIWVLVRA